MAVAFPRLLIKLAEFLQLHFVLLFERFNLRVRADEIVRRAEVRVFDVRDLSSERAQILLRTFEVAQQFFLALVTQENRHAGGENASNQNHKPDTQVSWRSAFVHCFRHLAFLSRLFPGCAQRFRKRFYKIGEPG